MDEQTNKQTMMACQWIIRFQRFKGQ